MKKQSKIVTGLVTLASVVTLAACSSSNASNSNIVIMKGDTITVSDFYKDVKSSTAAQQSMLNLIMAKVFEQQYGDKISKSKVEKAYNKTAKSYGSSFSSALSSAGLTTDSYKQQIRTTMLVEYAVKQAAKKELTTANYKKAYKTYQPQMTAQVIKLDSEDTAKSVLEEVKKDGADFSKIAKSKTTETNKKTEYKFDSSSTALPSSVLTKAFDLKEGETSEVVSAMDSTTYKTSYYIVKAVKKQTKSDNWKTYKKELKKVILNSKMSDSTFQNKVIAKALDKANVKIKDSAFSNILAKFASNSSNSSTSSSSSK